MSSFVEQIQQTKAFALPAEEASLMLMRLSSYQSALLGGLYAKYKLNLSTYNILRILRGQNNDGLPITEVAKRMVVRAPDITRCIDKLVLQGYVLKKKSGIDKRVTSTCITEEGLNLLTILDEPVVSTINEFMSMLSTDEVSSFIETSKKMMGAFDKKNPHKKEDTNENFVPAL